MVILIVALLGIAGGGYYLYSTGKIDIKNSINKKQNPENSLDLAGTIAVQTAGTTPSISESVTTKEIAAGYVKNEYGSATIAGDATITENCGSKDCFEKKFSLCEKTSITIDIDLLGTYQVEIIGTSGDGCLVKTLYLKNPSPEWDNKSMSCVYDNTLSFKAASEKVFAGITDGEVNCSGSLVTILKNL